VYIIDELSPEWHLKNMPGGNIS
jgi:hypothetical protein